MNGTYVGSSEIVAEAQRLNILGYLKYPIIPPTLRRWVMGETRIGDKNSPVAADRDIRFPVPKQSIKYETWHQRKVFRIPAKYLYLILSWHDHRSGGNDDYEAFAKVLEAKATGSAELVKAEA